MTLRDLAARAFLLLPLLPVACSAGDDSGGGDTKPYGGTSGSDGGVGYGGVGGVGTGGSVSGAGGGGAVGGAAGGAGGMGGGGGLGGGGGIGAQGGIAGAGGTVGTGAGGAGANTGQDPVIPPVTAMCPPFTNSTITFMGLGGIRMVAGPKAAGPTAPMVFYWHGTGSNSGEFTGMAGAVHQGVVAEGGVLISFQGTTGGDLLSGTNIFGAGDFNLTDQLVACAVRDHNINPRRIFATGCSAGGLFSGAMAVRRSNYMAAVAPNSGGLLSATGWQGNYTPALMTIHGAAGRDVVVVDFSNTSKTADDAFKARGGFVINCDHGGGHCGGAGLAPSIWEFFKAHPYGTKSTWSSLPAGFHASCKIY